MSDLNDPGAFKSDGWTATNARERHYRLGGRIVGKIQRGYSHGQQWDDWECYINAPRLRSIGHESTVRRAKTFVELAVKHRLKVKAGGAR